MIWSDVISMSREDLAACNINIKSNFKIIFAALKSPGCRLLFFHRFQQYFYQRGKLGQIISAIIQNFNYVISGCLISRNSVLEGGIIIPHPVGIVIGDGVKIARGCLIFQNVTLGSLGKIGAIDYPNLAENCTVYCGACILGGVEVAPETVVGANSVLFVSTQPGSTYVGTPARRIK